MTPRPGPVSGTGPEFLPGLPHRYGFSPHGNGAGCIASMHRVPREQDTAALSRPSTVSTFCSAVMGDLVARKAG